jgi:hypothetical protein
VHTPALASGVLHPWQEPQPYTVPQLAHVEYVGEPEQVPCVVHPMQLVQPDVEPQVVHDVAVGVPTQVFPVLK